MNKHCPSLPWASFMESQKTRGKTHSDVSSQARDMPVAWAAEQAADGSILIMVCCTVESLANLKVKCEMR